MVEQQPKKQDSLADSGFWTGIADLKVLHAANAPHLQVRAPPDAAPVAGGSAKKGPNSLRFFSPNLHLTRSLGLKRLACTFSSGALENVNISHQIS